MFHLCLLALLSIKCVQPIITSMQGNLSQPCRSIILVYLNNIEALSTKSSCLIGCCGSLYHDFFKLDRCSSSIGCKITSRSDSCKLSISNIQTGSPIVLYLLHTMCAVHSVVKSVSTIKLEWKSILHISVLVIK